MFSNLRYNTIVQLLLYNLYNFQNLSSNFMQKKHWFYRFANKKIVFLKIGPLQPVFRRQLKQTGSFWSFPHEECWFLHEYSWFSSWCDNNRCYNCNIANFEKSQIQYNSTIFLNYCIVLYCTYGSLDKYPFQSSISTKFN